jgi:hypothetical protein
MLSAGALRAANKMLADCLLECTGWGEIRSMFGVQFTTLEECFTERR